MSFPIFHLLAEVQIRGHFYWALKGTLSLGFNMEKKGIYETTFDETSASRNTRITDPGQVRTCVR